MKTTFKTFAFAAMMTVFGAATAFANNNNHKYVNPVHNHTPKAEVVMHANHNNLMKEYEMAKRCNCKNCREFVKKIEKQMKKNAKNNCHCAYCTNLHATHPVATHPAMTTHPVANTHNVGVPAGGRR